MPGQVVGEHAEEDVRPDAVFEAVVDRADLELGALEGAECALDLFEALVGAHDVAGWQRSRGNARAQDVEAVERGLGRDLGGLARVTEAGVRDLDLEVLLDAVALERRADREADLVGALKRAALDALLDLLEAALGRLQQVLALAGALGGDQGVAADDEALAGVVLGRLDLGQVLLVEERQLQRALSGEPFDLRRPSAP